MSWKRGLRGGVFPAAALVMLVVGGCSQGGNSGTPVGTVAPVVTPSEVPSPTPLPTATPQPTEPSRVFAEYRHPSGVFSLVHPQDWEAIDGSTARQILVRFIPPAGFGSRMGVEVTYEGPLTPEEVRARVESYIYLHYGENAAYREVSRTDLSNGQMQVVFAYDDHGGGAGRETLFVRYAEPYFAALRVFLAEAERVYLGSALETTAKSFAIDSQAVWGFQVAAINPAELILTNTAIWQDREGRSYYSGELYNASPTDITDVVIRAAFCNADGVILAEVSQEIVPDVIQQGAVIPFAIALAEIPPESVVCSAQVEADPARPDPGYTTAPVVEIASSDYHMWRRDLTLVGQVSNPTLAPLDDVEVVFVVYDAENQMIGYMLYRLDMEGWLEPGQPQPFEVVIGKLGGVPDHMATLVQARVAGASSPSLVPTKSP
jgi:hypothetical protein